MRSSTLALLVALVTTACADGSSVAPERDSDVSVDSADTTPPDDGEVSDADDIDHTDTADPIDALPSDGAADTTPADTLNPQADAWQTTWTRTLVGDGARVLGMRYLGGQSAAGFIALFDVTGAAHLDDGDGTRDALIGGDHRLVYVSLDIATGALLDARAIPLPEDATLGAVTKAPNGFAVALEGAASRVVIGQVFAGALRVASLEPIGESGRIALPAPADLTMSTSGGATTALALLLRETTAVRAMLVDAAGEGTALELPVPDGARLGFLALAPPTEDASLPTEGSALVTLPDLEVARVSETQSGPVLTVTATAPTAIGDTGLIPGQSALLIGALPEATADEADDADGVVPIILWSGRDDGHVDVVQIASAGVGGLALAGVGEGSVRFGDDQRELASQGFVATLGSGGGIVYSTPPCDRILGLSVGFAYRMLESSCDFEGLGPALTLTLIGSDFGGVTEPVELLLAPIADAATVAPLSGLVSLSVENGRAYGALVDLGDGPRLLLAREDGQLYDSGALPLLARSGSSPDPLLFQTLRQGGGGGGGGNNPLTNGVVFAVPREGGPLIGRARIDLQTLIW